MGLIIGFSAYLILMMVIGIVSYRKDTEKDLKSFMVGDKNFGTIITALGMSTTLASGYAFIGLVGVGYSMGAIALWQPILCTISEFVLWFFLAKKVKNYADKTDAITPIELLSRLKGDPMHLIKIFGGLIVSIFIMIYLCSQIVSGAKACTIFGIGYTTACVVSAVIVMSYTFLGGVRAVMWTDAIQGAMMILCFIIMIIVAIVSAGGFVNVVNVIAATSPTTIMWNGGKTGGLLAISMFTWIGISFGFLGQPQAIQKFMTMKSDKSIRKASVISISFNTVRQYFPVLIGLCGRVIYPTISDSEMIIPSLINDKFPGIFGGILLACIFASIMSTTDSLVLQASGEFSRNVLQKGILRNSKLSDKSYGIICKVLTIVITCGGLYLAVFGSGNVFSLTGFAFSGMACSIAPAMFLGFLWKKCTSWGILASIISGIPTCAIWFYKFKATTGIHEGVTGMCIAVSLTIIVSLLTQKNKTGEGYIPVEG